MTILTVEGITCAHCVAAVTEAVRALDPAARIEAAPGSTRVSVTAAVPDAAVADAIAEAGYPAAVVR